MRAPPIRAPRNISPPPRAPAHWGSGALRPLCVFGGERVAITDKITTDMSWNDIPTCKESGIDIQYNMLRGIFMPGGASQEQVDFYVELFKKGRETLEWHDLMTKG